MNDWYGIHHWRILWSGYRKLAWVEFQHTTTAKEKETNKNKNANKRKKNDLNLIWNMIDIMQVFIIYFRIKVMSVDNIIIIINFWRQSGIN